MWRWNANPNQGKWLKDIALVLAGPKRGLNVGDLRRDTPATKARMRQDNAPHGGAAENTPGLVGPCAVPHAMLYVYLPYKLDILAFVC